MRPVSPLVRAARSVARRRVPLLLLGLAVAAASLYAITRGGRITVRSLPPARVSLEGVSAGSTPLEERAVARGAHRIELSREGFIPLSRAVEVARGATYELDVVLRARDPADPEALRLLAAGRGLERAAVKVEFERSPVAAAAPVLLLPRGALREPPEELVLWADSPVTETTIRLEREGAAPGAPPLHLWTVANAYRRTAVAVPDEVRSALSAGRYRLAASSGADARFEILGEEERRATAHGLERLRRGFEPDDQAADFLAAEWLLSRGLYGEALAAAARLRQSVGECREVARLVLATLERAGLRDVGPWAEWAAAYLRAER